MGLLDYKSFLLFEDAITVIATNDVQPGDHVLGMIAPEKLSLIKSQLTLYSLETALKNVAEASGDPSFASSIRSGLESLSSEKLATFAYVIQNKPKIKFDPKNYTGSPSQSLWDAYMSYFNDGIPQDMAPLSKDDLANLWQINQFKSRGSVGPGEIMLTVFTDMTKGSKGDLQGKGFHMEVKGQNAKAESYKDWKDVKPFLEDFISNDMKNVSLPKGKGLTKEWSNILSAWINENPKLRIPQLLELIVGSSYKNNSDLYNVLQDAARTSDVDYGIFTCQVKWYAEENGFQYLLAFANPIKNSPISIVLDMSSASSLYNTIKTHFKTPAWEFAEPTGGFNLKGSTT